MKYVKLICAVALLMFSFNAQAGTVTLWEKVFEINEYGTVQFGDSADLATALKQGAEIKVTINRNNVDYSFVPTKFSADQSNFVVAWFSELELNGSSVVHRLQKFSSSGLLEVFYLESPSLNFSGSRHMTWWVKR